MIRKHCWLNFVVFAFVIRTGMVFAAEAPSATWEEKHKDWPVLILKNDIKIELNSDWTSKTTSYKRIKVQKEEGRSIGEIPIEYDKNMEKILTLEGYSITEDGKRHKVTKIQDVPLYNDTPVYSDQMMKVLTMPEVNVGTIVEVRYTILSKGLPMKNQFWLYQSLQFNVPIKELDLTVILPKKSNVQYKPFDLQYEPTITEKNGKITYHWELREVEENELEEFLPPPTVENTSDLIQFSSLKDWKEFGKWYYGLIEKNTISTPEIEAKVNEIIKDKVSNKDKITAILEYLQDNFRYVSMSLGDYTLEPHPTDQVFKNKYGDCKDLALLARLMLMKAGIESDLALFNLEFNIFEPDKNLPIPNLFNHVVLNVKDGDRTFFVDPLLKGYAIDEMPVYFQAAHVYIVNKDGGLSGQLPIFDGKNSHKITKEDVYIHEDGSAVFEDEAVSDLDSSVEFKQKWRTMTQKEHDKVLDALDAMYAAGGKVLEKKLENIDERYGVFKILAKYERANAFPVMDNMIVVDIKQVDRGTDFSKKERENPIFNPINSKEESTITYHIPPNYEFSFVPEDINLNLGIIEFVRHFEKVNNVLIVKESYTTRRQEELPVEKYEDVKKFFNDLTKKTNQRVIIKKKETSLKPAVESAPVNSL